MGNALKGMIAGFVATLILSGLSRSHGRFCGGAADQGRVAYRDRMRFLDLELDDPVPDASTIWLFREALAQAGLIDKLFERFGQHLEAEGYIARRPKMISPR